MRTLISGAIVAGLTACTFAFTATTAVASEDCDGYGGGVQEGTAEASDTFTTDSGAVPSQGKSCEEKAPEKETPAPKPEKKPEPKPEIKKPEPPKKPEPKPTPTPDPPVTPRGNPEPAPQPTPEIIPPVKVSRDATPPARLEVRSRTVCYGVVVLDNSRGGKEITVSVNKKTVTVPAGQTRKIQVPARKNGEWRAVVTAAGHHSVEKGRCGQPEKCVSFDAAVPKDATPETTTQNNTDGGFALWQLLAALGAGAIIGGLFARRRTTTDTSEDVEDEASADA